MGLTVCRGSTWLLASSLAFLLTAVYYLPDLLNSYYVTNFYDSWGHMTRGIYMYVTGHSTALRVDGWLLDSYYWIQPGFFWVTAMLFNIYNAEPSRLGLVITAFVKWFHLIFFATG